MKGERRSEAIWIESKKYWQIKVQKDGVRLSLDVYEAKPQPLTNGWSAEQVTCDSSRRGKIS